MPCENYKNYRLPKQISNRYEDFLLIDLKEYRTKIKIKGRKFALEVRLLGSYII